MNEPVETVRELAPGMTGRWLVLGHSSTQHVWDLDVMTYERRPTKESHSGPFLHDGVAHAITHVAHWPEVGGRFLIYFHDPEFPVMEHSRISSVIAEIRRLDADDGIDG